MTTTAGRPQPEITDINREYWQRLAGGELVMQRCDNCGELRLPPAQWCPGCLSEELTWVRSAGEGTVHSIIVFHQVYHEAFREEVPYNVAVVQLDEGPRIMSNIVTASGAEDNGAAVGDRVSLNIVEVSPGFHLPKFVRR